MYVYNCWGLLICIKIVIYCTQSYHPNTEIHMTMLSYRGVHSHNTIQFRIVFVFFLNGNCTINMEYENFVKGMYKIHTLPFIVVTIKKYKLYFFS